MSLINEKFIIDNCHYNLSFDDINQEISIVCLDMKLKKKYEGKITLKLLKACKDESSETMGYFFNILKTCFNGNVDSNDVYIYNISKKIEKYPAEIYIKVKYFFEDDEKQIFIHLNEVKIDKQIELEFSLGDSNEKIRQNEINIQTNNDIIKSIYRRFDEKSEIIYQNRDRIKALMILLFMSVLIFGSICCNNVYKNNEMIKRFEMVEQKYDNLMLLKNYNQTEIDTFVMNVLINIFNIFSNYIKLDLLLTVVLAFCILFSILVCFDNHTNKIR